MSGGTQLSYSHGISTVALLGETIGENLRRIAAACADRRRWSTCRPGAVDLRGSWTPTSTPLRARPGRGRDRPGDRVGIWAPNCAEWVLVQYATARIGAILVNINPAYRSHELAYVLRQSGVRLLVSARELQDQRLPRR